MKSLEPGCMALIISGMCAGSVVTVVCHLPAGSQATYKATHRGKHYSEDCQCLNDVNWLITGVNGMELNGQLVEICEVTAGDVTGTAIFDAKNLLRLDDDSELRDESNPYLGLECLQKKKGLIQGKWTNR